ncbi:MAG: hypothetical protein KAZ14_01975 [Nitrosomonas sp.]|nr:hypothetical protein [Nitrosomonas sp.]HRB28845.1 hypothetical protein [Nitrosomonas sp.]
MSKELTFEDDELYSEDDLNDASDAIMDSQIPESRFAEIIDEYEASNDYYDSDEDNDISSIDSLDSLDLH